MSATSEARKLRLGLVVLLSTTENREDDSFYVVHFNYRAAKSVRLQQGVFINQLLMVWF